jgi:hypothetical protein
MISPEMIAQWVRRYPPRSPRIPPRPLLGLQAGRELAAPSPTEPAPGNGHGGGRGPDQFDEDLLEAIRAEHKRSGHVPVRFVRRLSKEMGSEEFRHDKAQRAITEALAKIDITEDVR